MAIQNVDGKWQVIYEGKVVNNNAGSRDKARAWQKAYLAGELNTSVKSGATATKTAPMYYTATDYEGMLTKDLATLAVANGITGCSKAARTVVLDKLSKVQIRKEVPTKTVLGQVTKGTVAEKISPPVAKSGPAILQSAPRYNNRGNYSVSIVDDRDFQPYDGPHYLKINGVLVGQFESKIDAEIAKEWCFRTKATSLQNYRR